MSLAAKMVAIMSEVRHLEKDADNAHFGYKFTSDSHVYNTVRAAMIKHGVAIFTKMPRVEQIETTTSRGKPQMHTLSEFVFVLVDVESGDREECPWHGEADDQNDKGVNKTATAALKYFLLKTFIIPTGDDPDAGNEPALSPTATQPTNTGEEADLLYKLLLSTKPFDMTKWDDTAQYLVRAGLADNEFHALGRLRKICGAPDDATVPDLTEWFDDNPKDVGAVAQAMARRKAEKESNA